MNLHLINNERNDFLESNRFGIYCVLILLVGALGGIAIGFRAIESGFAMGLVALPAMIALSFMLSMASMRIIVNTTIISLLIDLVVIFYYWFIF